MGEQDLNWSKGGQAAVSDSCSHSKTHQAVQAPPSCSSTCIPGRKRRSTDLRKILSHLHDATQSCERWEEQPEQVIDIEKEIEAKQDEDEDQNNFVEINWVAGALVPLAVHLSYS